LATLSARGAKIPFFILSFRAVGQKSRCQWPESPVRKGSFLRNRISMNLKRESWSSRVVPKVQVADYARNLAIAELASSFRASNPGVLGS
jgi:hypothetical protein